MSVSLGLIFICQRGKIDSLLLISVSLGRLVGKCHCVYSVN